MTCRSFNNQIADYVAGRLSPSDAARMEAHRAACPACARTEARESALRDAFTQAETATACLPCPDLRPRLRERISAAPVWDSPPPRRRSRWGWGLGLATAAAAAALAGVALLPPMVTEKPSGRHTGQLASAAEATPVDEDRVVSMVSALRWPGPGGDPLMGDLSEGSDRRERALLLKAAVVSP